MSAKYRPWTGAEDRQLRSLRERNLTAGEIGRLMGRSRSSIEGRIRTLRLPPPRSILRTLKRREAE